MEAWLTPLVLLSLPELLGPSATLMFPVVSNMPDEKGKEGLVLVNVPTCEPLILPALQLNLHCSSLTPSPAKLRLRNVSGVVPERTCEVVMDCACIAAMQKITMMLVNNLLILLFFMGDYFYFENILSFMTIRTKTPKL